MVGTTVLQPRIIYNEFCKKKMVSTNKFRSFQFYSFVLIISLNNSNNLMKHSFSSRCYFNFEYNEVRYEMNLLT